MLVQNAALSLNGEYLLMMAKQKEGPNRLYLHSFKTGNTGEIQTGQAGLDENAQWGAPTVPHQNAAGPALAGGEPTDGLPGQCLPLLPAGSRALI